MIKNVPIALMVFNRPDLTRKVITNLSYIKPPIIYIIADGPRNEEERIKCEETRHIATNLPWKSEIVTFFRDENVGMVKQFKEGLDFVFSKHDRLLFLEDDHLISQSSYKFVSELLDKYANDDRVGHINLSNFAPYLTKEYEESYFYSSHIQVWGFATWRRMWDTYDISMPEWSNCDKSKLLDSYCSNIREKKGRRKMFDLHSNNKDPWTYDYQWVFNCYNRKTLSITPSKNLCTNIGFERQDATHNKGKNPFANSIEEMDFPLTHPCELKRNIQFDKNLSAILCPSKFKKLKGRIDRLIKATF